MFAPHLFSTGWKPRHTALTLLLSAALSSPGFADTTAETTDTTRTENTAADSSPTRTTGRVARAIFTTAIADREPVDNLKTLTTDINRVYFFTDLRGLGGQIVTHRWQYAGQEMARVTFKVGEGARWRVYSSKNLLPEWTGTWTVQVNDESGQRLQSSSFEYVAPQP